VRLRIRVCVSQMNGITSLRHLSIRRRMRVRRIITCLCMIRVSIHVFRDVLVYVSTYSP
jgi:hypothetical protein